MSCHFFFFDVGGKDSTFSYKVLCLLDLWILTYFTSFCHLTPSVDPLRRDSFGAPVCGYFGIFCRSLSYE